MKLLLDLVLAALVILSVSLQKTYAAVPLHEIKRRARKNDEIAKLLYRAATYGSSLRAVLWTLIIICSTVFFLDVSRTLSSWLALLMSISLIWVAYVWLPSTRVTKYGERVAAWLAPVFAWLLNYLHPVLGRLTSLVRRHRPIHVHTGVYEKSDLVRLIDQQEVQADNRIDKNALEIARSALTFGDQLVRDHLVPKRVVKSLRIEETVGPVLMTELHTSGHSRFPVYDGKKDNIVGTLYMRDLIRAKSGGTVAKVMKSDVCYVHEEQSLYDAMQAILKTRHHLLVVVNSFEEYVGIITMEDVLEQIVGTPILDEFDQYNDLRAVATRAALVEHNAHVKEEPNLEDDESKSVEIQA